jgi:hypothetical protein
LNKKKKIKNKKKKKKKIIKICNRIAPAATTVTIAAKIMSTASK